MLIISDKFIQKKFCSITIKKMTLEMGNFVLDNEVSEFDQLMMLVDIKPRWFKFIALRLYGGEILKAYESMVDNCSTLNGDGGRKGENIDLRGMLKSSMSVLPYVCRVYGWSVDDVLKLSPRELSSYNNWASYFDQIDQYIDAKMQGAKNIDQPNQPALEDRDIPDSPLFKDIKHNKSDLKGLL